MNNRDIGLCACVGSPYHPKRSSPRYERNYQIKRILLSAALLTASSVAGLMLCEVILRLWGVMGDPASVYTADFESLDMKFNNVGMRDRDFTSEKADDVFRILVLGDSITFGVSVKSEQTYAKQLESMLNTGSPGVVYEVYNTGVPGWNTSYQYAYLKSLAVDYQPDLVLLGFCLNDAEEVRAPDGIFRSGLTDDVAKEEVLSENAEAWLRPLVEWRESGGGATEKNPVWAGVRDVLASGSHLFRFVRWRYDILSRSIDAEDEYPRFLYESEADSWKLCRDSLEGIATTADSLDIPAVLAIFPLYVKLKGSQVFDDGGYPWQDIHAQLAEAADEFDMAVADLLPEFVGFDPRDISVDPYHPNPLGHQMAATAILRVLREERLLEGR